VYKPPYKARLAPHLTPSRLNRTAQRRCGRGSLNTMPGYGKSPGAFQVPQRPIVHTDTPENGHGAHSQVARPMPVSRRPEPHCPARPRGVLPVGSVHANVLLDAPRADHIALPAHTRRMFLDQCPVGRDTGQHTLRVVDCDVPGRLGVPRGTPRLTAVGVHRDHRTLWGSESGLGADLGCSGRPDGVLR
jgi:hypothetical protein